ncbi:MAG TPA: GH25 family lysozyme, partial [Lachnospiraceae bacterium]|nr:GH25 family lysozyme [Lachnospiraceae bacterium]
MKRKITRYVSMLLVIVMLFPLFGMEARANVNATNAGAVGVDVSKYQGAVDWAAVRASGVTFAFIKAYSSKSGVDPYFVQNVAGANAAGIRTGAYVYSYATSVDGAVAEANAMINILGNVTVTFPVVIDIEDSTQRELSPDTLAAMANAFCATIANAGYYPMVYSSKYWFQNRIGQVNYDKWIAMYADECEYPETPAFWQYTSNGSVGGIGGRVDMNYQYKDFSFIIGYGFSSYGGNTYFYNNYRRQKGWIDFGGVKYYCDDTGAMRTGWIDLGGTFYYLGDNGVMCTGFTQIGENTYYLGDNGIRQSGLQKIGRELS